MEHANLLKSPFGSRLFEASIDPLLTMDTLGAIVEVNEACVNMTGISREKLQGSAFAQLFTDPAKAEQGCHQAFEKGSVTNYPLTMLHADGSISDLLCSASVLLDQEGKVIGAFAATRDVTDEKFLSSYSLSLIEASRDPLFTISPEGRITDINEATLRVTGKSREDVIGTQFVDYFTDPLDARKGYQLVFAQGFVSDLPLTMLDGSLKYVLFNGAVYRDSLGNVKGAVMVARDLTEQKRTEEELINAKVYAELATIMAEEAQLKAEDAMKSKQQFLSNMSHEIRTPLNAIIGFTKVILKTELTPPQKEYLDAIKLSGDALIVLIDDILDMAKVDAGKMVFEKIVFRLKSSLSAMIYAFEIKIHEKNIELVQSYDERIPELLEGDPIRLNQILVNLLGNALKFTSSGRITVTVVIEEEDDSSVTLRFEVADTGIGIEASQMESIFNHFQQANSNTTRLYGGTGLGLAIVKQLVEQQGGRLEVRSTPNEGSTFAFLLRFSRTDAQSTAEAEVIERDAGSPRIRVLMVEDIPLNQLLMRTLLDDFGFEYEVASNGKVAIEWLSRQAFDIVLMDLQMPVMNGFEATDHIRNVLRLRIPIMALTADVTTVDLEKCKAVGMNDYIAKPVNERLLHKKIINLVRKSANESDVEQAQIPQSRAQRITNLDFLKVRTKSDPKMMAEMIKAYLDQTPPLVHTMRSCQIASDWDGLHAAVHKMIPSFFIMGMSSDLENIARKVQESSISLHGLHSIPEMIDHLEAACNQACKELVEELTKLKGTTP
jgi:PAS domain S-box-containing protein